MASCATLEIMLSRKKSRTFNRSNQNNCSYCVFKCINERKLRGHIYHIHPMQKYKCHVCYQHFSCYSSLTSHSSRKHKVNLTNLPFTNVYETLLQEANNINATESQIIEEVGTLQRRGWYITTVDTTVIMYQPYNIKNFAISM